MKFDFESLLKGTAELPFAVEVVASILKEMGLEVEEVETVAQNSGNRRWRISPASWQKATDFYNEQLAFDDTGYTVEQAEAIIDFYSHRDMKVEQFNSEDAFYEAIDAKLARLKVPGYFRPIGVR